MVAEIVRLPQRAVSAAFEAVKAPVSSASAPLRSLLGPYQTDDWGRDQHFIDMVGPLLKLRWDVALGGIDRLPTRAPALLVCNNRSTSFAPLLAAMSLSEISGRPVRFAGRPDIAPVGSTLRRLGGLIARPDEVRCALRHGEVVIVSAEPTSASRDVGAVDHRLLQPAVLTGAAVIPMAVTFSRWSRQGRVELGPALRPHTKRRGPLAEVELADAAVRSIQRLLDGFGVG